MIDPDLDVGKKLANPIELQKNIEARGLENINIQKLVLFKFLNACVVYKWVDCV